MTYYIITIGCQMNKADSERIASFLETNNYQEKSNYTANLVIINTCGVRQSAEDRVYGLVKEIKKKNKLANIIITGCLANRSDVKRKLKDKVSLFLVINQLPDLFNLLDKKKYLSQFNQERLISGEKYLNIKAKYSSNFSAYVPIGNGCNNYCSYCVVPYARGREVYRPAQDIIKEVKNLILIGYKEIILIAQNVNSYQKGNYNFPKLLAKLANLEGDFWLRFSSSHPKDLSDQLISVIAKNNKICNHLHLALQSGDDIILKKMNRQYQASDFIDLIKKVRQARKDMSITTDIIVGFPGETNKQFKNTVKVYKKVKFDLAYIAQYSKRPQTAAYNLTDNVKREIKKKREKELTKILKEIALENNKSYLNREVRVLIDSFNRKKKLQGKTASFKTVVINNSVDKNLIGQFKLVKIIKVKEFNLEAEII